MQGDGEVRRPRGLKLRNGIWWIDKAVRHGSKSIQIRESTGCRDLKSAIRVFDIRVNGVVPLAGHDLDLDAYKAWVGRLRRNCQKNARDREFRLTEDEVWGLVFRANGRCEVSGMPFDISMPRKGRKKPFAPRIDRIDISKGYVVRSVIVAQDA